MSLITVNFLDFDVLYYRILVIVRNYRILMCYIIVVWRN